MNFKRILDWVQSALIPFNCNEEWVLNVKENLGCAVASLPIKYLGILLGANPKRVETWKLVIQRIESKLSNWKAGLLSQAGKLVLIKAAINNLLMYYLGLFRMPKVVAKKIISL